MTPAPITPEDERMAKPAAKLLLDHVRGYGRRMPREELECLASYAESALAQLIANARAKERARFDKECEDSWNETLPILGRHLKDRDKENYDRGLAAGRGAMRGLGPAGAMRLREWWSRRFGEYAKAERAALPDGTRVRLICPPTCRFRDHEGVWLTSWTPRRTGQYEDPDDYRLTRESDGETTFAARSAIEPVR